MLKPDILQACILWTLSKLIIKAQPSCVPAARRTESDIVLFKLLNRIHARECLALSISNIHSLCIDDKWVIFFPDRQFSINHQ